MFSGKSLTAGSRLGVDDAQVVFTCNVRCQIFLAGDLDGDQADDFVIQQGVGSRYYYHFVLGSDIQGLSEISMNDSSEFGELKGLTSSPVAAAGDVDGDGLGDLLIGAGSNIGASSAHLLLGSGLSDSTFNIESQIEFSGASSTVAGGAVANAGDVDGDGLNDVLIGASGAGGARIGVTYLLLTGD